MSPGPFRFEPPTALEHFRALVAVDEGLPLLEAAITVALDDEPALDVPATLAQVDALAQRFRARLPADAAPLQKLRLLNRYFFQELGFGGNVNNYYDAGNSLLPTVLSTRRGIPITLAVLYVEIATQAGLQAWGISFPGHFLVKVHLPAGEVVIDPFTGESLSREALEERLLPYREQRGLVGAEAVPLGLFLQPAPPRDILARILRNLREVHRSACDWLRVERVQARLVVLLPEAWEEQRDHALVLAELGRHAQAADALDRYLAHRPEADDADALRRRLAAWRRLAS